MLVPALESAPDAAMYYEAAFLTTKAAVPLVKVGLEAPVSVYEPGVPLEYVNDCATPVPFQVRLVGVKIPPDPPSPRVTVPVYVPLGATE